MLDLLSFMNTNNYNYQKLVLDALNSISTQRTQEIISLRYGLRDGQKRTLEEIGRKYGITRERVRQIEQAAFFDFKKSSSINILKPLFKTIDSFLNKEGKVVREERLLSSITGIEQSHPAKGAVFFALTLGEPYQRLVGLDKFHPLWTSSDEALKKAEEFVDFLITKIEEGKKVVSFDNILDYSKQWGGEINKKALASYLDVARKIAQNSFGYFGLSHWPEINPRGAKDKAYIVLKEQGRPLHFRQVTDLINQAGLGTSLAQAQTVHNELIKDDRFILVGRGIYALSDWGYQPGTIKDVIIKTLEEDGPLAKDEIIKKVMGKRVAKPNTILINLQNKEYFTKDKQGRYFLIKK